MSYQSCQVIIIPSRLIYGGLLLTVKSHISLKHNPIYPRYKTNKFDIYYVMLQWCWYKIIGQIQIIWTVLDYKDPIVEWPIVTLSGPKSFGQLPIVGKMWRTLINIYILIHKLFSEKKFGYYSTLLSKASTDTEI